MGKKLEKLIVASHGFDVLGTSDPGASLEVRMSLNSFKSIRNGFSASRNVDSHTGHLIWTKYGPD